MSELTPNNVSSFHDSSRHGSEIPNIYISLPYLVNSPNHSFLSLQFFAIFSLSSYVTIPLYYDASLFPFCGFVYRINTANCWACYRISESWRSTAKTSCTSNTCKATRLTRPSSWRCCTPRRGRRRRTSPKTTTTFPRDRRIRKGLLA